MMAAVVEPEYVPDEYDLCDDANPRLEDHIGWLRDDLVCVESAIDFDTKINSAGVRASKGIAAEAYSYGDGVFWSLLGLRSQSGAIGHYVPGHPVLAEVNDWSKAAEAKWQCADFVARDAIEERKYRDAIDALHQGYIRLRTGTTRHELSTLIRQADKQLAELLESTKRAAKVVQPKPATVKVLGKALGAEELMAIAAVRDIGKHGDAAVQRSLGYWATKTGRHRSTIQGTKVYSALRDLRLKPEPVDEVFSVDDSGYRKLQNGRRINHTPRHYSEYDGGLRWGGSDHHRLDD